MVEDCIKLRAVKKAMKNDKGLRWSDFFSGSRCFDFRPDFSYTSKTRKISFGRNTAQDFHELRNRD
jgi:hypothetical protein